MILIFHSRVLLIISSIPESNQVFDNNNYILKIFFRVKKEGMFEKLFSESH